MKSQEIEDIVFEVLHNKNEYSQQYIGQFGIDQSTISLLRNGKRNINNIKLSTTKRLVDAYNYHNCINLRTEIDNRLFNNYDHGE
ncbi:hypothetical protein DY052_06140 [Apilactobacillus timberlakei]|uniref:hypothetical protein n=1 Tax=Apilactobacillus timberlakei TaxID=2008380 RepID=UPI00112A28E3|nr:hypothetical protein [Apilactobacillus timberlakei]TPR15004.1 hypothetical protein DY052_06140 [Apilactobacillus timberlakei]